MIALALFIIAGICKAVSDCIAHGKIKYTSAKWDVNQSWKAKWKNGDPQQGEAFFGSSTFLVSLTDPWHLFNFIQYTCFTLAVPAYYLQGPVVNWWADAILMGIIWRAVFEVCYRKVFAK